MAPSSSSTAAKADAKVADAEAPADFTSVAPGVSPQSPEAAAVEAATVASFPTGEVSETGVYVNVATGEVTTTPPERAKQLVPPGGEITPDRKAAIDAAETAYAAGGGKVPGFDAVLANEAAADQRATEKRG